MSVVFPTAGDSSSDYEDDDDWDWGDDGDNASAAELWPHLSLGVSLPSPGSWPCPVPAASSSSSVHRSSNKDSNMGVEQHVVSEEGPVSKQPKSAYPSPIPCTPSQPTNTNAAVSKSNQLKRPSDAKEEHLPAKRLMVANHAPVPTKPSQSANPHNSSPAPNRLVQPCSSQAGVGPPRLPMPGQLGPPRLPMPGQLGPQRLPIPSLFDIRPWPMPGPRGLLPTPRPGPFGWQPGFGPAVQPRPNIPASVFGPAGQPRPNIPASVMDSGDGRCLLFSGKAVPNKSVPVSILPQVAANLVMEKWSVHIPGPELAHVDFLGEHLIVIFSSRMSFTLTNLLHLEDKCKDSPLQGDMKEREKHLSIRQTGSRLDQQILDRLSWLAKSSATPSIRYVQRRFGVTCYKSGKSEAFKCSTTLAHAFQLFSKKQESQFKAWSEENGLLKPCQKKVGFSTMGEASKASQKKVGTIAKGETSKASQKNVVASANGETSQPAPKSTSFSHPVASDDARTKSHCDRCMSDGQRVVSYILSDILDIVVLKLDTGKRTTQSICNRLRWLRGYEKRYVSNPAARQVRTVKKPKGGNIAYIGGAEGDRWQTVKKMEDIEHLFTKEIETVYQNRTNNKGNQDEEGINDFKQGEKERNQSSKEEDKAVPTSKGQQHVKCQEKKDTGIEGKTSQPTPNKESSSYSMEIGRRWHKGQNLSTCS